MLPMYAEVSRRLIAKGKAGLSAVNCFDWTDVCAQQNVLMYPTIRIYSDGAFRRFTGMLSEPAIYTTALLYVASKFLPIGLEKSEGGAPGGRGGAREGRG